MADTFFPVDEFGHVHPSGIVNTSMKFSWYCPGGKIWEIQNVVQIFLYKSEEKYISQIRNEQILEDYDEKLFDSLIFFVMVKSDLDSKLFDLYCFQGKKQLAKITSINRFVSSQFRYEETGLARLSHFYSRPVYSEERTRPLYNYYTYSNGIEKAIGQGNKPECYPDTTEKRQISADKKHEALEKYCKRTEKIEKYLDSANRVMRSKSKPDDNGLYPDEIAVLVLLETGDKRCKYPNRKYQLYPALLSDTSNVIDRLYQKKFIKYDIPGSGIKIAEWNVLRKYYKKVCNGKSQTRNAIEQELSSKIPAEDREREFPERPFCLTELGLNTIDMHPGIEFAILTDRETGVDTENGKIRKGFINIWNIENNYSYEECEQLRNFYYTITNCEDIEINDFPDNYKIWCVLQDILKKECGIKVLDKCGKVTVQDFLEKYKRQFPAKIYENKDSMQEKDWTSILYWTLTEFRDKSSYNCVEKGLATGIIKYIDKRGELHVWKSYNLYGLVMDMEERLKWLPGSVTFL